MTESTTEFSPRKTFVILAIVAGCFAMLCPKIFYPMLTASINQPHTADSTGCCNVIFENDVTAVDIMQELCYNIVRHHQVDPRVRKALEVNRFNKLPPASANLCREEVLSRCGIDISFFLAEKEKLKMSYKQVLEEIRGFNGSLCLKEQFGVPLSRLGTPHLIRYHILMPHSTIRQERQTPPHAGSYHPALRERGRAIPSSHIVPRIQDRPDHMAPMKMRPPMGGAGHVVAVPQGNGSLGFLMPLYTIGIVIFFLYTISKVLMGFVMPIYTIGNVVSFLYKILQVLRKNSDSEIIRPEYSTTAAEREYQKLVFNPEVFAAAVTAVNGTSPESKERPPLPMEETPPTMEELQEHQARKSYGLADGVSPNLKDSQLLDQVDKEIEEFHEATPTVKVVNMEMTASCEGGHSRPTTPILITHSSHTEEEKEKSPPISIYLEGALPPQCELLVTDSRTQECKEEESVEVPVVLSGKMTLSLISLDQEFEDEIDQPDNATASETASRGDDSDDNKSDIKDLKNKRIEDKLSNKRQVVEICESGSEEDEDGEDDDEDEDEEEEEEEEEEEGEEDDESIEENNTNIKNYGKPTTNLQIKNEEPSKQSYKQVFSTSSTSNMNDRNTDIVFKNDESSNSKPIQTTLKEITRQIEQNKQLKNNGNESDDEQEIDGDEDDEDEEEYEEEEEEEYEEEEEEEEEEEDDESVEENNTNIKNYGKPTTNLHVKSEEPLKQTYKQVFSTSSTSNLNDRNTDIVFKNDESSNSKPNQSTLKEITRQIEQNKQAKNNGNESDDGEEIDGDEDDEDEEEDEEEEEEEEEEDEEEEEEYDDEEDELEINTKDSKKK